MPDQAVVIRREAGRQCATLGSLRAPRTSTPESTPSTAAGCAAAPLSEGTTAMVSTPHPSGTAAHATVPGVLESGTTAESAPSVGCRKA